MIRKSWDTLTTRFILVMSAALIISNVATTVLLQSAFERLIAWNVRFSQANEAARVIQGRAADDVRVWVDDLPLATGGVHDLALSERLWRASGDPVRAVWIPIAAEFQEPPFEADGEILRALDILLVSRRLDDGRWSNFTVGPRVDFWPPPPSPIFIFLGVSLMVATLAAAFVGSRVARPFRDLARGADQKPVVGIISGGTGVSIRCKGEAPCPRQQHEGDGAHQAPEQRESPTSCLGHARRQRH